MFDTVLEVSGLNKTYRGKRGTHATNDVSFGVGAGEILGVLGHNGAGKTTLVNQIVGILKPDSGTITVAGVDAVSHPAAARRLVSVQAQSNVPITGLTPRKAIELVGRIRGLSTIHAAERAGRLLNALDLDEWSNRPAQKISGGVARLTAFAMAAVAPGKLVILDEPTNDVDPVRRRLLWQQIRVLKESGTAVLLVTHNVMEAEHIVDNLIILDEGRVIAEGTPASLAAPTRNRLTLKLDNCTSKIPDSIHVVSQDARETTGYIDIDEVAFITEWASTHCERFSLTPTSLEDIYIALVDRKEAHA